MPILRSYTTSYLPVHCALAVCLMLLGHSWKGAQYPTIQAGRQALPKNYLGPLSVLAAAARSGCPCYIQHEIEVGLRIMMGKHTSALLICFLKVP